MRLLAKSRVPKAVCHVIRSSTDSQLKCRPPRPQPLWRNGTTVTHQWQITRPIAMTAPALAPIPIARGACQRSSHRDAVWPSEVHGLRSAIRPENHKRVRTNAG